MNVTKIQPGKFYQCGDGQVRLVTQMNLTGDEVIYQETPGQPQVKDSLSEFARSARSEVEGRQQLARSSRRKR
jgi:hypothetical protein